MLAVLTDPELREELDRVAAAVGVRVVHAGGRVRVEPEDLVGGRGGGARRGGGASLRAGGAAAARPRQRADRSPNPRRRPGRQPSPSVPSMC